MLGNVPNFLRKPSYGRNAEGLAPQTDSSVGKTLRSPTNSAANRTAQAFRLAALCVSRSDGALGLFYRRLHARSGPSKH